ncbi:MAG: hypothetical protein J5J04_16580 [Anaerolineae bacterium]|nr:hypothetical protein [Anaerolineae bacterium]
MTETAPTEYANEPTPETEAPAEAANDDAELAAEVDAIVADVEDEADGGTAITTIEDLIGLRLLKKLHEEISQLGQAWVNTPQIEQQRIIDRMRASVEDAVRAAVSGIASAGFTWAPAAVESLTIKDGAKAVLTLARSTDAMHDVADHVGSAVVIVFADSKRYLEQMHEIKAQADQRTLPLE